LILAFAFDTAGYLVPEKNQQRGNKMKALGKFFRSLVSATAAPAEAVLGPDDFLLTADGAKLSKPDGKPIAVAKDTATATEIVDRLNADEQRNEEDKWSA